MNELKELKKELRVAGRATLKALESYKKSIGIVMELSGIEVINKKALQDDITETMQKVGLSENYIKKIRGMLINFFEGAKKYPEKKEDIILRVENIDSVNDLITLSRNFKKDGSTEKAQKEKNSSPKNKGDNTKRPGDEKIDYKKYFTIISKIVKITEDDFFSLDDTKKDALIEEALKIAEILGKIKD